MLSPATVSVKIVVMDNNRRREGPKRRGSALAQIHVRLKGGRYFGSALFAGASRVWEESAARRRIPRARASRPGIMAAGRACDAFYLAI